MASQKLGSKNIKNNLLELPLQPKPFLRWAGGKRKMAPLIEQIFPEDFDGYKNKFFEPFVGGGALSFYLGNKKLKNFVPGKNLIISDSNPELIITYTAVRDHIDELIERLYGLSKNLTKSKYLEIRSKIPKLEIDRAARFIYLNKTCFNGLWRVNSKGEFNVPWGKLKNPKIFDENELRIVSARLENSKILNANFTFVLESAERGDVVYFDPPYIPISASSSFSKYAKDDFLTMDHYALAGVIEGLTRSGVKVILSNSDSDLSRQVYQNLLTLKQIDVQRSISALSSSRKSVKELLGTNFKINTKSNFNKLKAV